MKRFLSPLFSVLFVFIILHPSLSSSTTLTGRGTTSFYFWESQPGPGTEAAHVTGHSLLSLDLRNIGRKELGFFTYAGSSRDFGESVTPQENLNLYSGYLRWRDPEGLFTLSAGRQFFYAGVGKGNLDGLRVDVRPYPKVEITAFGGTESSPSFALKTRTFGDSKLYGARIVGRDFMKSQVSLSYVDRTSKPAVGYVASDTNLAVTPGLAEELMGIDIQSSLIENLEVHGRVDYDLHFASLRHGALGAMLSGTNGKNISVDLLRRQPSLQTNSILNFFGGSPYTELLFQGGKALGKRNVSVNYATVLQKDVTAHRWGASLSGEKCGVSYAGNQGTTGQNHGFSFSHHCAVSKKIEGALAASLSTYKPETKTGWQNSAYLSLGAVITNVLPVQVDIQTEFIRNALYDMDTRMLLKFNYQFCKR